VQENSAGKYNASLQPISIQITELLSKNTASSIEARQTLAEDSYYLQPCRHIFLPLKNNLEVAAS